MDERQFLRLAALLRAIPGVGEVTYLGDRACVYDPGGIAEADALIQGFDWDDAGTLAAWELGQARGEALATAVTRSDTIAIATRAMLRAVVTLLNDRIELLGGSRLTEADILAFVGANPTIGDPARGEAWRVTRDT